MVKRKTNEQENKEEKELKRENEQKMEERYDYKGKWTA